MITYKIHLIRTGKTYDSPVKHYVGRQDPPLCEQGILQLESLVEEYRYPKAEMVLTSPLRRCVETAEILYPNTYTEEEPQWLDMHLGDFQGKTYEELQDDEAFLAWLDNSLEHCPPGGEKAQDFTLRTVQALHNLFQRMMAEQIHSVAVVTHGGVMMSLLAGVGLPKLPLHQWAVDNGCGYTLLMTPQMWMRDHAAEVFSHLPVVADREEGWN